MFYLQVFFAAPTPGPYRVHVCYNELGTSECAHIRGSPFSVTCSDPWARHRLMGTAPARRKGLTMTPLGKELVLYGGDQSGLQVCHTEGTDWR